jgi:DNA polymerase III subunit epsilon
MWLSPRWETVVFWSLDLETGGLDPQRDPIIAVGMVPVRHGVVRLGEAFQSLVRPAELEVISPASMRAHHLVPRDVREAPRLEAVLAEVDARLREGALLVHHASLDVAFLKRAYRAAGKRWFSPPVVDTVTLLVKLEKRKRFLDPDALKEPELNLTAARRLLDLPTYQQHDALSDAVATAELFLVLRQRLEARTLRQLR